MTILEIFSQLLADYAMTASLLIILFLFIVCILRPFFARLFDAERMRQIQADEISSELAKKKREKELVQKKREAQAEREFNSTYTAIAEEEMSNGAETKAGHDE